MDGGVGFSPAVKPTRKRKSARPCGQFLSWLSRVITSPCDVLETFFPKANVMKWLVLPSEFGQFGPIQFGESRRAARLYFIPIQVSSVLNRKLPGRQKPRGPCSMEPQPDSHRDNKHLILWETLTSFVILWFLGQPPLRSQEFRDEHSISLFVWLSWDISPAPLQLECSHCSLHY